MSRTVDNNGIGALYATFEIHKTDETYDLTAENIGNAVSLTGNNEISHGSDGGQYLGRLEYVSGGLATVQVRGISNLLYNTSKTPPIVGNCVVVDGGGRCIRLPRLPVERVTLPEGTLHEGQ
jgi:hypothetical protein